VLQLLFQTCIYTAQSGHGPDIAEGPYRADGIPSFMSEDEEAPWSIPEMSMSLKKALEGKFLKGEDIPAGSTVTYQINDIDETDLSRDKDGSELKPVMTFVEEGVKPMVLNKTNMKLLAAIHGTEPADYLGKQIGVYCDPTVTNPGGQMVGGLRLTAAPDNDIPL